MTDRPLTGKPDKNYNPAKHPPVMDLSGFVNDVDENNPLDIEVAVNEESKVVMFHNRTFKADISWFEYDLESGKLNFVLDGGQIRDAGLFLTKEMSKYMQNSYQILMVLLDDKTGEATQGNYVPLIVHRS